MLYIRADMNSTIASGHIMRCLSIADAYTKLGGKVSFVTADDNPRELLAERGYSCIVLNSQWDRLDEELDVLADVIEQNQIKLLLIDSYYVTPAYLKKVSKLTRTFYIDDIDSFQYPVDGLICYSPNYEAYNYPSKYGDGVRLLLGPEYTPLRREFSGCEKKQISNRVRNVLLLSGGSNNYNVFDNMIKMMSEKNYEEITVVCGRYDESYERLRKIFALDGRITLYKNLNRLSENMKMADLVITAGGTTCLELCAVGTPFIVYALADNQLPGIKALEKMGLVRFAGDVRDGDISNHLCKLLEEYESPEYRRRLSDRMQSIIDGRGAERIAVELNK